MTIMSAARYPLSISVATLITALLFFALFRVTAPMDYVPPAKSIRIDFHQVRPDTPPVPKQSIEKPEKPQVVVNDNGGGIALPQTDHVMLEKTLPYERPATAGFKVDGVQSLGAGTDHDAGPVVRVAPLYPPRAAQLGITGWVRLRYTIAASGAVTNVSVVESEPRGVFDAAAVAAVSNWRYRPKILDGVAVEQPGVETRLRFELQNP